MSNDRYDPRRDGRGSNDPRSYGRGPDRDRDRHDESDRGFFERAGDEISSWFGDEEAERRRERDDQQGGSGRYQERGRSAQQDQDRGGWFGGGGGRHEEHGHERGGGWFGGGHRTGRGEYGAEPGRGRPRDFSREQYGPENMAGRGYGRQDSEQPRPSRDEYRPFTGDYGRSSPGDRGGMLSHDENRGGGRRDTSAENSRHAGDPHYHEWRQRQIEELDNDYDEYRREHQSKFANDFSGWRSQRQSKRQLLGQVSEHMEVVGSDEQRVGTVDKVRGDRVILAKNDPESGGVHRSLGCSLIDRVEGDRLILTQPADQAKRQLQAEDSGSRDPQRQHSPQDGDGPHILDRSFSGTYK